MFITAALGTGGPPGGRGPGGSTILVPCLIQIIDMFYQYMYIKLLNVPCRRSIKHTTLTETLADLFTHRRTYLNTTILIINMKYRLQTLA